MPTATPKPQLVQPPTVSRGRKGAQLPEDYLKSIAELLSSADPGSFASTGEDYDNAPHARKAVELVRRELVRIGFVEEKSDLSTRIWDEDGVFKGAIAVKA